MDDNDNQTKPEEALRKRFEGLLLGAALSEEEKRALTEEILNIVYCEEVVQ